MFVSVVCVMIPRFELVVTAGDRALLLREPVAIAPEQGGEQRVGEVSPASEGAGVRAGMRLSEALARCPRLVLLPPDPAGVAEAWEQVLARVEGVGAAVDSERPGLVCFEGRGLLGLYGGSFSGLVGRLRSAVGVPARIGIAPSRFSAMIAASRARQRSFEFVDAAGVADYLAPLPVSLLRLDQRAEVLVETLERLGVATLGDLAEIDRAQVADRFGASGLHAYELVYGRGPRVTPRQPLELLEEKLDLPEAASGQQLGRALELLIERLLARPQRRGRMLRSVSLSAVLAAGGTWREQVVFRQPLSDPERMRLALSLRIARLPAPASRLRLAVERFGPLAGAQGSLLGGDRERRRSTLRDALAQARTLAGEGAALRVLEVDPHSRLPERRAVLAPFES